MSGHTHTLAEWAAFLSLGAGIPAAVSVPYFLLVDAECWAWPRPLVTVVDRAVRSEALYLLLREWDTARHTVREFCRDAAALLILLTTSPKGAMS
ncbi:hypothetical protein [Streptomyces sp. NPDC088812]|uniref:hypothetical protein n=1 Tax=Streptomyces sp. NPDC088812 TaxID=3365905 RepID=UPI00380B1B62